MVIDIIKFFFIYMLVLFAFACGLNQLLWYYADMEKKKCHSLPQGKANWDRERDSCLAWRGFSNLFESCQSLFWASLGLVELKSFELTGLKSYTRFWGLLMFGTYNIINVVVLLNLLIAMMNNSYMIISERADVEWKFARTKLFLSYIEKGFSVPPPFNILPTAKNLRRWLRCKWRKKPKIIVKKGSTKRSSRYQAIMRNLVWRYVTKEQCNKELHSVNEDDMNELRQDVSAFRYELLDVLQNNGMETGKTRLDKNEVSCKRARDRERRLLKDFSICMAESVSSDDQPVDDAKVVKGMLSRLAELAGIGSPTKTDSIGWNFAQETTTLPANTRRGPVVTDHRPNIDNSLPKLEPTDHQSETSSKAVPNPFWQKWFSAPADSTTTLTPIAEHDFPEDYPLSFSPTESVSGINRR